MRYSRFGYWGAQAGAVLLTAVAAVVALWILPPDMIAVKAVLIAVVSVIAVAIALTCYRSADEVILETHKTAWFWGSMAAAAVIGPVAVAILAGAIPMPLLMPYPHLRPEDYYAEGILAVLAVECVGFVVFWAYHNLGRRG
jgi:hypothetical protein